MARLDGLGAALVIACTVLCTQASVAETTASVTVNFANGVHDDRGVDLRGHGVVPLFKIEHRYKRVGAFVEFAPTGSGRYLGSPPGGPDTVSLSYWSAGARWYSPRETFYVGAGLTDVNQRANYLPYGYTFSPPVTRVSTVETRRWRSASFLYEAGATVWHHASSGLTIRVAFNPTIRTRQFVRDVETHTTFDASGNPAPVVTRDEESMVPLRGSQFDAMLALTTQRRSSAWSYGVRFLNYRLFNAYGGTADKDVMFMPFIGYSHRIGH